VTVQWAWRAACGGDPEYMFVPGAHQNVAKRVCTRCPVRMSCLVEALDNRIEHGVWGGLTDRERRALLRRHPTVRNWRQLLDGASTEDARTLARVAEARALGGVRLTGGR